MLAKKPKKPSKSVKYHHVKPIKTEKVKNVPKVGLAHHEKVHGVHHVANKPKTPLHHHEKIAGIKKIRPNHTHMPKSNLATPMPKPIKPHIPMKPRKG